LDLKVFISHHSSDSAKAKQIADRLLSPHGVLSYLDVVDHYIGRNGEDLADHLRKQMATCDHLIAVISINTKASQWVPWEIGVATEKDYPLAAYSEMITAVPEFLAAWPRLRSMEHVDAYVRASRTGSQMKLAKRNLGESYSTAQAAGTRAFYTNLRSSLRT
jgi:hypothetical protein